MSMAGEFEQNNNNNRHKKWIEEDSQKLLKHLLNHFFPVDTNDNTNKAVIQRESLISPDTPKHHLYSKEEIEYVIEWHFRKYNRTRSSSQSIALNELT